MRELRDSTDASSDVRRARLHSDGYVFVRALLDPEPLHRLAHAARMLIDDLRISGSGSDLIERFRVTRAPFATAIQRLEDFHRPTRDPGLVALLTSLAGEPVFAHPQRLIRTVFPHQPYLVTPPHQDYRYIRGSRRTLTAWVPIATVTPGGGGIAILRGSHRIGDLPLRAYDAATGSGVDIDMTLPEWETTHFEPGDVAVFTANTVHAGTPNASTAIRLSVDYRFQPLAEPVAARSLLPTGHPAVPDWPDLLAGVTWPTDHWLGVPRDVRVVEFDDEASESNGYAP